MGADEVEGADRTSASAAQAVRERVEAVRASVDIAQALGSDDSVIDLKTFQKLKAAFDEADADGGGDLCVDEFVQAFQMVIPEVDEARLRHLFTRIDANADNTVDWDEFSSFILLEGIAGEKAREAMDGTEYVLCEDGPKGVVGAPVDKHKDMCTAVMRFQKGDSYATASRDGTIRVWAHDDSKGGIMTHRKTAKTGGAYIVDAAQLPASQRMLIACADRKVKVYDPKGWVCVGTYGGLPDAPLCATAWEGGVRIVNNQDCDYFAVGDDKGAVTVGRVIDMTDGEAAAAGGGDRVRYETMWRMKVHDGWVNSVRHLGELNSVASGGGDGLACITDLERKGYPLADPTRRYDGHNGKSVNAVSWTARYKKLVSCGEDKLINLWNPLSAKPQQIFVGHEEPIVKCLVLDDVHQIVTLDVGKRMHVWDLRSARCVQVIHDKESYHPTNMLGALGYDAKRNRLVTGAPAPKCYALVKRLAETHAGHKRRCVAALWNRRFYQVVSCDEAGGVRVWDVFTGKISFRFEGAEGTRRPDDDERLTDTYRPMVADRAVDEGDDEDMAPHRRNRLTCACFDHAQRRLMTGSSDGNVRLWNFANGVMLKEMTTPTIDDVTGLVHAVNESGDSKRVVSSGWNGLVTVWEDLGGISSKQEPRRQMRGHESDVLCVAEHHPGTVASGDFDGVVIVWNVDNGGKRHKLIPPPPSEADANESSLPVSRAAECVHFIEGGGPPRTSMNALSEFKLDPVVLCVAHADGRVRMWNAIPSSGALLCDFHAGHGLGESVLCVATDPRATRMVTADSAGRCRLWDVAGLVRRIHSQSAAAGEDEPPFGRSDVELLGYWQAHSSGKCVNAARWLEVEGIGVFFTTAGDDCAVHLWSRDGQHVGEFGPHRWTLEDTRTWANTEFPPDGDFPRTTTDEDGTGDADAPRDESKKEVDAEKEEAPAVVVEETTPVEYGEDAEEGEEGEGEEGEESPAPPSAVFVVPTMPDPESFRALAVERAEAKYGRLEDLRCPTPPEPPAPRPPSPTPSESALDAKYPTRPGYKAVQPNDFRPRWTADVPSSFEAGATYRRIQKMDSSKANDLRGKSKEELRAIEAKLSAPKGERHERVYIPAGDEHINNPEGKGRAFSSLYHLLKIRDVAETKPPPETSKGLFKYGQRVDDALAGRAAKATKDETDA